MKQSFLRHATLPESADFHLREAPAAYQMELSSFVQLAPNIITSVMLPQLCTESISLIRFWPYAMKPGCWVQEFL